jgi:hypothetical protein
MVVVVRAVAVGVVFVKVIRDVKDVFHLVDFVGAGVDINGVVCVVAITNAVVFDVVGVNVVGVIVMQVVVVGVVVLSSTL